MSQEPKVYWVVATDKKSKLEIGTAFFDVGKNSGDYTLDYDLALFYLDGLNEVSKWNTWELHSGSMKDYLDAEKTYAANREAHMKFYAQARGEKC